ncbi:scyllo-inositol 2-dehydrogenase (NAD(+)) [bacterium HR17]|uniref:Scyllo-inositol 2-dehydrogenase (NAD(+)) n=1 Tax=Candidatus Fervidibacter japonicus TaxID=2035412 RepID=A0A2H5XAD2_9BACT|nr:scyllo-inositol 2-dehydrogenase (NAD(+)) [bacterium HR17]
MEALRFGVVGCGGRGASVAELMMRLPSVRLVAVCDTDSDRARQVGERLQVPAFTQLDEMLAQVPMDAIYIATTVEQHFTVARRAILDGKHILVEKMMTTSAAEAWELVRLAEVQGVCGAVSYQLRFYPSFQRWWELAQDLQPLVILSSRHPGIMPAPYLRAEPWAGITDFLTHDVDLVLWVAGREPDTVFATDARNAVTDTDAIDTLCVTLQFDSVMTGMVYGSMAGWGVPNAHVVIGRRGNVRIVANGVEVNRLARSHDGAYERVAETVETEPVRGDTTDRLLEHFSAWVQGARDAFPLATLEDGLKVMLVHEAIWESCRTGQPVSLATMRQRLDNKVASS